VISRLKVIDRFESQDHTGLKEADAAAAELKMASRNFYRLIARVRELGRFAGLPRFRTKQAAFPALVGLTHAAEEEVRKFVADASDTPLNDLTELIIRKAEAAGEKGPQYRGNSTQDRGIEAAGVCHEHQP
jgi:hypothetical protein